MAAEISFTSFNPYASLTTSSLNPEFSTNTNTLQFSHMHDAALQAPEITAAADLLKTTVPEVPALATDQGTEPQSQLLELSVPPEQGSNVHPFLRKAGHYAARLATAAGLTPAVFATAAMAMPAKTATTRMHSVPPTQERNWDSNFKFKILGQRTLTRAERGDRVKFEMTERNNNPTVARKVIASLYVGNKEQQYAGSLPPGVTEKHDFWVKNSNSPNTTATTEDHVTIWLVVGQLVNYKGRGGRNLFKAEYNIALK